MRKSNRVLAALLSVLMIISMLPVFAGAAAYGFSDFPTGSWSEEAVTAAVNNGLLQGKGGGIIAPQDNLTRAEAAAVINRAFGATVKADISEYTDVNPGDWYYSEFQKAVNMGTIVGEGDGILNPNGYITREAMFTVVARALVLSDAMAGSLSRFVDGSDTSVWAASYVSAMAKRGYVNGDNEGRLNPQAYITREEFAQVMHNIFKMYISTSGNVAGAVYGTTVIRVPNVTLTNVTISGDLVLGDGVGAGDVIMNNVKVSGRILCRGGEGKVQFVSGCSVGEMVVVHDINGVVNFHNYRNEKIFDGIVLDTEATFLGSVNFNTGGSSSSSKKNVYYKVITYKEDVNTEGEYGDPVSEESVLARKGNTITYTPETEYGFVVDTDKSVLSGTNNGSLEIKVYYKRDTFKVTLDGTDYDYRYQEPISKDTVLEDIITNKKFPASVDKGYKIEGYYTEENGKGDEVDADYIVEAPVTVYPYIVTIPYGIEYQLNGGTLPAEYEDTYTVDKAVILPVPTKGTSKFLGWYKDAGFTDGPYETIPALAAPGDGSEGSKYVFYAKWPDNAAFKFEVASTTDTEVRVNVILDKIPEDIENGIKNIVINYTRTGAGAGQLVYSNVISGVTGSIDGSADGIIKWTGDAFTAIPTGGVLFTLVFTKDKFATGEATFTYGDITLTNDTESSTAFDTAPLTFDIGTGKTKITVKYKNVEYSVYEGEDLYDAQDENGQLLSSALSSFDSDDVPAGFTHQGFKFDGENGLITPETQATAEMDGKVIVPNFVAIKYDIIYDVNTDDTSAKINGESVLTLEDVYDIDTYKDTNLYKLHDLTSATIVRDGYTFIGWHLEEDLSDGAITHIPNKLLPEGNSEAITVYAEWEQNAVLGLYANATATDKENLVIDVILNKLPVGTTGITSVTFEYDLTATDANAGIAYKSSSSTVGTVVVDGNKITWTGDISSISNTGVTLFTITFTKNREATGNVTIDFVDDKATILDATGKEVTYGYDVKGITTTVNGDQLYTITFNNKDYQAYATDKLETAAVDLDAAVKELLVDALNAYEPKEHYEFKNGKKFIINGTEYTIDQIKEIVVNGDITITSAETPIEYTVKYMDGKTEAVFDAATVVDSSYNIDEPIDSLPEPASKADEGLKFASWHTDASLSDASKVDSVDVNSPRDNDNVTTLYAKWDAIEYKLVYVLNGGKVGDATDEYAVTLDVVTLNGKEYILIDENVVEWADDQNPKYFKGWYKDAALTAPIDKIDDITKLDPENPMYVYADWGGESVLSLSYELVTVEEDITGIKVYVELSDFPKDIGINDLSAITVDYIMEGNSEGILTYKGVEYIRVDGAGNPLGTTNGTFKNNADGRIVWNANSSADRLTEIDNNKVLFVITFAREDLTKGGKITVKIDAAELANYATDIARGYTIDPNGIVIDIPVKGDDSLIVEFNGTEYYIDKDGKLGDALSNKEDSTTKLATAMDTALENAGDPDTGYKWVFNVKNASNEVTKDVDKDFAVTENITLTLEQEPIPYEIKYHLGEATIEVDGTSYTGDEYTEEYTIVDTLDADNPRKLYSGDVTQDGHTFMGWLDEDDKPITALALGQTGIVEIWADMVKYPVLSFEKIESDISTEIKVAVTLEDIPHDLESITSIDLTYVKDIDDKLTYVGTEIYKTDKYTGIGGTITEEADGTIRWTADAPLSDIGDKKLFVITYTKALTEEGKVKFSYDEANTTITGLDAQGTTVVADKYTVADKEISLTKSDIHTVYVYKGVSDKTVGEIIVEHKDPESTEGSEHAACKITQAQLDEIIDPATYSVEKGYTDSDGNVHKIMPEYWYEDESGEWKLFDVDMEIIRDMDVYLLTRYAMLTYQTDFEIKGYSPKIELSVAYDSNTEIIKSGLDALTAFGRVLDGMLDDVEMITGIDPYEKALEKAAKTGFVDEDGNLLNPLIPVPLHRIVTKSIINDELDRYIEDNKENDDFIADLISNDHVEAALLASKDLRNTLLTNTKSKDIIKDYIKDNKDDATLKADIQKALKSTLKADTVKMLEDDTIKQSLISAVDTYLSNNNITKISASEVVDKIIDGTLESYDEELYEDVMAEYDRVFDEKYENYFISNYDQLMTDHFDSYFDDTVEAYINNGEMDEALRTYITDKLVWYEQKLINEFIDGTDRTLLHDAIVDYEDIAIATIKTTKEYNQPIDDFASGNGVRVNEGNIVFIEILDELMHTYDYDKLAADFLPENIQKVVDLVGHDIVADIVNEYFAEFCRLMDDAVAKFNADYDAGITDAEYTFSTKPAVRINYMDIVETYYNKVMNKIVPKLNSKQFVANNPYVQKLLAKDWILEFLDYDAAKESEEMSGYSIKKGHYDDVMETYGSPIVRYYDILLENVILVHDAVMWYNTLGEASLEDKLDAVSQILGVYANKANDVIMHYIETGELPKGYTPYELADKFLGKVLGVNDKIDGAYDKVEDFYEKHEEKITEYIDKAKTFYEDYLDRDYTEIIDLANLAVYADGNAYEVYKILLEMSEENNAFNIDTLATAIFDSTNYHGINKLEDVMAKIKSKLDGKNRAEEIQKEEGNEKLYIRDAYRATLNSREIKGYNTGTHTVTAQRHLRYIIR